MRVTLKSLQKNPYICYKGKNVLPIIFEDNKSLLISEGNILNAGAIISEEFGDVLNWGVGQVLRTLLQIKVSESAASNFGGMFTWANTEIYRLLEVAESLGLEIERKKQL